MSIQITLKHGDKLDELTVNTLYEAKRSGRALYVSISKLQEDMFVFIDIGDCPKAVFAKQMENCGANNV